MPSIVTRMSDLIPIHQLASRIEWIHCGTNEGARYKQCYVCNPLGIHENTSCVLIPNLLRPLELGSQPRVSRGNGLMHIFYISGPIVTMKVLIDCLIL
jgi:hypothetical protein